METNEQANKQQQQQQQHLQKKTGILLLLPFTVSYQQLCNPHIH